jgi:hypothetical protein
MLPSFIFRKPRIAPGKRPEEGGEERSKEERVLDNGSRIFNQRGNDVADKGRPAQDIILDKDGAVIPVQSAIGADPQDTVFILQYTLHGVVAQPIFLRKAGKRHLRVGSRQQTNKKEGKDQLQGKKGLVPVK